MPLNRRDLCALLPLVALTGANASTDTPTLASGAFRFEDLQPRPNADGTSVGRSIVKGAIPTGEQVEVHETTLSVGVAPHPPHRHKHSEFWLVREGTVEITVNGKSYRLGP